MITSELQGGLGNMMFQMATAISLAIDNGTEAVFDMNSHHIAFQGNNATVYKSNIFRDINEGKFNIEHIFYEKHLYYEPIEYKENLKLFGYFQSHKYFVANHTQIIDLFSPDEKTVEKLMTIINNLTDHNEIVSLHVRRGDYLKFTHIYSLISIEYIMEAISHFPDHKIIVLSDDILWCKENINHKNIVYLNDTLQDYEELWLMSLCDHNIISNSSFSWWGSYLNKNEKKKVIMPKNWFNDRQMNEITKDINFYNTILI